VSEIVVIARARVQPGHEADMEAALQNNAASSRCEEGCLSYSVLRGDNGAFMTVERWRSHSDFDQHMAAPHVQNLLRAISPWLAEPPEIQVLREV
jgi:quinol monooxygenase YgiN